MRLGECSIKLTAFFTQEAKGVELKDTSRQRRSYMHKQLNQKVAYIVMIISTVEC